MTNVDYGVDTLPTFSDVVAAAGRLSGRVRRTPVLTSDRFDARLVHGTSFFKCENLQRGGAFKLRGAFNALLAANLPGGAHVATHSSGNHGTAVALAARDLGLRATVVMPRDSAKTKFEAVERAGARIVLCEPGQVAREAALRKVCEADSAFVVHPFDDATVIAGQGTAALELFSEVPDLDTLVVPVGGGGLLGGSALVARSVAPKCRVIAAEPADADDTRRSFVSRQRQSVGVTSTVADGLRGSIGVCNFQLLLSHVDDVVTVSEDAIRAAMRIALGDLKLVIEPSSAVVLAALLGADRKRFGDRVGVILSGGNVDLESIHACTAS